MNTLSSEEPRSTIAVNQQTPYQHVVIEGSPDGSIFLFLNGERQTSTMESLGSHALLAALPCMLSEERSRSLVLGGGDGQAAHMLLKSGAGQCIVVELDHVLVELFRTIDALRRWCGDAFNSDRVQVFSGDALQYVADTREHFDVVVFDADLTATEQPRPVTAEAMIRLLGGLSKITDGICVTMVPTSGKAIEEGELRELVCNIAVTLDMKTREDIEHWLEKLEEASHKCVHEAIAEIYRVLLSTFFDYVELLHFDNPWMNMETYFYCSHRPLPTKIPCSSDMHVPKDMFQTLSLPSADAPFDPWTTIPWGDVLVSRNESTWGFQ